MRLNENKKDKSSSLFKITYRLTYLFFIFVDYLSDHFNNDKALTVSYLCEN